MPLSTIILDRDGVVNYDSDAFIKSPSEWQPIPGSLEAIARLKHAGLRVVVASNQSGIGRNLFDYADLFAIHDKMRRQLSELGANLDGIFFCPHTAAADCYCRKPRPGLLNDILSRWNLKADACVMLGDSATDIEAARAINMTAFGVRTGKPITNRAPSWQGIQIFDNLATATSYLLEQSGPGKPSTLGQETTP